MLSPYPYEWVNGGSPITHLRLFGWRSYAPLGCRAE